MKIITGVINVVLNDGKVLLLKRAKDPFLGYWALLGGKIEFGEHPEQTALRELKEESGLDADDVKIRGMLSEVVKDKGSGEHVEHFVLFVCELNPTHTNIVSSEEGELKWFDLSEIKEGNNIAPSDIHIIRELIIGKKGVVVHKSHLFKQDKEYVLERFSE